MARIEDAATSKFGAYKIVPESEAAGHQIMGSRYVYKRKVGKSGAVSRWKARMVVQGLKKGPNAQDVIFWSLEIYMLRLSTRIRFDSCSV